MKEFNSADFCKKSSVRKKPNETLRIHNYLDNKKNSSDQKKDMLPNFCFLS